MPFNIGPGELIIVLVIALIVVGPGKLPDVGSALGKSIREFRKAAADVKETTSLEPDAPAPTPGGQAAAGVAAATAAAPAQQVAAPAAPVTQAAPPPPAPAQPAATPQPAPVPTTGEPVPSAPPAPTATIDPAPAAEAVAVVDEQPTPSA